MTNRNISPSPLLNKLLQQLPPTQCPPKKRETQCNFDSLSDSSYIRQAQLIPDVLPWSPATHWRKCNAGEFPKPVKLSERVTAWRVGDVRAFLAAQAKGVQGGFTNLSFLAFAFSIAALVAGAFSLLLPELFASLDWSGVAVLCSGVIGGHAEPWSDPRYDQMEKKWKREALSWLERRPADPFSGGPLDELSNVIDLITDLLAQSNAACKEPNGVLPEGACRGDSRRGYSNDSAMLICAKMVEDLHKLRGTTQEKRMKRVGRAIAEVMTLPDSAQACHGFATWLTPVIEHGSFGDSA